MERLVDFLQPGPGASLCGSDSGHSHSLPNRPRQDWECGAIPLIHSMRGNISLKHAASTIIFGNGGFGTALLGGATRLSILLPDKRQISQALLAPC